MLPNSPQKQSLVLDNHGPQAGGVTTTAPRPATTTTPFTERFDPRLLAALGSFCISLSSVFIKVSHASGSTSAFWRCLLALPLLLALAAPERRESRPAPRVVLPALAGRKRRKSGAASRLLLPLLAVTGFWLYFVLWGEAIPRIGAGIATVLLA